jgi:hypothetical protein
MVVFTCDGCDATIEDRSGKTPVSWFKASVVVASTTEPNAGWEVSFDLCDACARRIDPRSWVRAPNKKGAE